MRLGRFLRENSFPFTHSDPYHGRRQQSKPHQLWSQNLHDAQAAIIYTWGILLLIALASFGFLAMSIHRAFQRLSIIVNQLGDDRADVQIDVSGPADVRNLSEDLENLRVKLHNEERLQQQFLRHISHEIKTPLTSIREGSKLLDEQAMDQMNQEQRAIVEILVSSSEDLQSAIENLLDYNSVVAASNDKQRQLVSLKTLVEQALVKHELTIRSNNIDIKLQLDESPATVDSEQILSVFNNLISNAIKHSPESGIIDIQLKDDKEGHIYFVIKDQGKGVPSGQEELIFEPFFVGKQSSKMTLRGTGLGLSIAKQYVDAHNGDIRVLKSSEGSVFQVTLPNPKAATIA